MVAFDVPSTKLANALATYGMEGLKPVRTPRADLLVNGDFWRGVVDGDGSLFLGHRPGNRKPSPYLQLVGMKHIVFAFREFVASLHDTTAQPREVPEEHMWRVGFRYHAAFAAIKLLYENAVVALDRKQIAADTIIASYAPRHTAA